MASVSKLLEQINELKKKEDRVEALRSNGHHSVKMILKGMFDPNIKFLLPEGEPPYKPSILDEPKALLNEISRFYLFVEGGHQTLRQTRREQIFINILESVNADDAKLLIAMKDKKSPYKGITYDIVKESFPELNLP
jgi:hypothetical protein